MRFFHLDFREVDVLARRIYNACAIFRQSTDVKSGGRSQQPSVFGRLLTGGPQRTVTSRPEESQSSKEKDHLMQQYFQSFTLVMVFRSLVTLRIILFNQ